MAIQKFNDGQEIVESDLNDLQKLRQRETMDILLHELLQRRDDAFFGDSFFVDFVDANTVSVRKGLAIQFDGAQTGVNAKNRPVYLDVDTNMDITAPNGALDRIDIVCIKASLEVTRTENRYFKNESTSVISLESMDVEQEWIADMQIVAGTPAASPVAPATPAGYLKVAELLVTTVTGIANQSAITDSRDLLPLGEGTLIDSSLYVSLTAGLETPLKTLLAEIDALLKRGKMEYFDLEVLGADPAAPLAASGRNRLYLKSGVFYRREEAPGGAIVPIGSGGGGGGSAVWSAAGGVAPLEDDENGEKVWLYEAGGASKLTLFVKVPQSYISGRPISMYLAHYSPSTANTQLMRTLTTLIRKNNDAMDSVANQRTSTNAAVTNTVANQYREALCDLSSSVGTINGVNVSAGDILKVELTRGTDTDTDDIRFVPSGTEIVFQ